MTAGGDCYLGNVSSGHASGRGRLTHFNGSYQEGNWLKNKQTGLGTERWNDGGFLRWNDGSSYVGNYKDGVKNGKGKMTFADKSCYDGSWLNNQMSGEGLF